MTAVCAVAEISSQWQQDASATSKTPRLCVFSVPGGLSVEDLVEKILLQDHADRLVDTAAADQKLLVATFANGAQDLLVTIIGIDPVDIHARRHDVGDAAVANVEDALDDLLLGLIEKTPLLARRDEQFQLFG
jgi:hypothetical protein